MLCANVINVDIFMPIMTLHYEFFTNQLQLLLDGTIKYYII